MKFEIIISSILKTITVIAGIYICLTSFVTLKKQQLKNQAVSDCFRYAGTYEFTDVANNIKSIAPQKNIYTACMVDKGYTTSWK